MTKKILWIEDDYYHVQVLVRPLMNMDFIIDVAESYGEAKKSLVNWRDYDLFILDLLLPNWEENSKVGSPPWHYGRELFYYMTEYLKVDKPILIISIVQYKDLIGELIRGGGAKHLEKIDLLPTQVTDAVLSLLDMNKEEDFDH